MSEIGLGNIVEWDAHIESDWCEKANRYRVVSWPISLHGISRVKIANTVSGYVTTVRVDQLKKIDTKPKFKVGEKVKCWAGIHQIEQVDQVGVNNGYCKYFILGELGGMWLRENELTKVSIEDRIEALEERLTKLDKSLSLIEDGEMDLSKNKAEDFNPKPIDLWMEKNIEDVKPGDVVLFGKGYREVMSVTLGKVHITVKAEEENKIGKYGCKVRVKVGN